MLNELLERKDIITLKLVQKIESDFKDIFITYYQKM